ncbi:twin-arginine translocation signal domain-containing protein [Streptomyces sp. NBC_01214]|uniref:twin-arginine translocation signal domain-containing protein n=1 Tax=Streptomyces sp. NBC_01214 TaxID=2903777 RepID=UPI00224E81EF|nr:twin-arginine translocation signal domain-containing protein [Streptomyces sp. NBC_01214]MCX4804544.1 twin-arginine translocation signal domain-containing protein [Streptomyces sp. NBC_01214]
MSTWTRRGLLTAGTAAGAVALIGAGPPSPRQPQPQPLDIVTGEDGFSTPATAVAGAVTSRVRTTSPRTGNVGIARLRRGIGEAAFRRHLRDVFEKKSPEDVIQASKDLMADAELMGGAMAVCGSQSSFTAWLPPGPYLVLEYKDFEGPYIGRNPLPGAEYVSPLLVRTADHAGAGRPRPSATITAVDTARGPRFVLEGRLRRDRPLRYVNAMRGQVDELAVYPLTDDSVTEADIQRYFQDTQHTPEPFDLAAQLGTPPLSPGRSTVIELPVDQGRYALTSWVASMKDAQHLSAHGQVLIVTVP